jgi:2'-5' RNA ligase
VEHNLSAVVVTVPEAEPRVGALRAALDPHAALGVPAHVTIMFPFVPPTAVDDGVLAALREVCAAVPAFEAEFSKTGWFDDALWWAPEPAEPFVALSRAVSARFGLLPYEGEHGDGITPHLTIGYRAPIERLRAAEAEVLAGPPVRAAVRSAVLLTGSRESASWTTLAELPLGGG